MLEVNLSRNEHYPKFYVWKRGTLNSILIHILENQENLSQDLF